MARTGITQDQVNSAADALLLAGERPTIERIRTHLGTGSPNTVNRLLDVWWAALGARLTAAQARLAIPNAPDAVHVAAGALWATAMENAQSLAAADVAARQAALAEQSADLDRLRDTLLQHHQKMQDEVTASQRHVGQAMQQVADLQRLTASQEDRLADLADQLARARSELQAALTRADDAQAALVQQHAAHTTALAAIEARHQTNEDRWLVELDRVRQELAAAATQARRRNDAHAAELERVRQAQHQAIERSRALQEELAASRARADELDRQLERAHSLLKEVPSRPDAGLPPASKRRGRRTAGWPDEPAPAPVPADAHAQRVDAARARRDELLETEQWLGREDLAASATSDLAESGSVPTKRRKGREPRLLGVRFRGRELYPTFQFDADGKPLPQLSTLIDILPSSRSNWSAAFWLFQPTGRLKGARPADMFAANPSAVIAAARKDFQGDDTDR